MDQSSLGVVWDYRDLTRVIKARGKLEEAAQLGLNGYVDPLRKVGPCCSG